MKWALIEELPPPQISFEADLILTAESCLPSLVQMQPHAGELWAASNNGQGELDSKQEASTINF